MKTEEIKKITLEFEGSEIDTLKSAVRKISTENQKAGFNRTFLNPDEIKIIDDVDKSINK